MEYLIEGFLNAFHLLFTGDEETYSAVFTTVHVSSMSIIISLIIGLPAGFILGYYEFTGKKQIRAVVDTLLALPTVVVGLLVYAFVTRKGPLGDFNLLFEVSGIIVGQVLLILPIVISLSATAIESLDERLKNTLITLGARGNTIIISSLYEARFAIMAAAVNAYSRAISEVGVSMMIGGNIKWHTRTITTAIALETGKGQFAMGIALGIVLLAIGFFVNWVLIFFKKRA
ncbi:MAG TPA: ABC transporter permease [Spirochaetota bacterium]|nr:ABC transporter permease [Spirochaetota bacterium]HPF06937.1 ABC transporter permease [Spirochaetota bacterium]HPJ42995.1 ABC transporter permease [Spirochaetota bacterium]HPR37639.1 ABC transporter permease [Spirochaetota bacterium]HRX46899.1 ABC transporter permease [Spirochaetota bacterium]